MERGGEGVMEWWRDGMVERGRGGEGESGRGGRGEMLIRREKGAKAQENDGTKGEGRENGQ